MMALQPTKVKKLLLLSSCRRATTEYHIHYRALPQEQNMLTGLYTSE